MQTGNKFQTRSSEVGFSPFPSPQPGEYHPAASVVGMATGQVQVTLQLGQTAVVNPVRCGLDAFNVFKQPGLVLSGSTTAIFSLRVSAQGARTLQYDARPSW